MSKSLLLRTGREKLVVLSLVGFLFLFTGLSPSLQASASQSTNNSTIAANVCGSGYVPTPDGCAPASCVYALNSGAINTLSNGVTIVTYPDGSQQSFAPCKSVGPKIDTNGWVEDGQNEIHTTKLSSDWTVPKAPSSNDGQIIYMFDGTQNCICGNAFILQPVIQWGYNGAFGGAYWVYASWYCDSNCFYSTPIHIAVGNSLSGTVVSSKCKSGYCDYKITGKDDTTGKSTILKLDHYAVQEYSFATLEVYNVVSCSDYPASGSTTFTHVLVNGKTSSKWSGNVLINDGCGENVVISGQGSNITLDY